jgi:crossover junction endodeoxyribonuclease RusA
VFIAAAGREYRDAVLAEAYSNKVLTFRGRLSVWITAYPPDRRTRDLDNVLKALLDACTHAKLWDDDSQIDELHVLRGVVEAPHGFIEIAVRDISGEGA